jgi:hypothetical protein
MKRFPAAVSLLLLVSAGQQRDPPHPSGDARCHGSYPTVCIPPPPPDLDCPQVPHRRFRVVGSDPHGFDGDHDGIGCESSRP